MRGTAKLLSRGTPTRSTTSGNRYDTGWGVPEDDAEAVRWYRLAAEQGDARAQKSLGGMYANGDGVPEDAAEAIAWYRRAAEQGDATAQFGLWLMYQDARKRAAECR